MSFGKISLFINKNVPVENTLKALYEPHVSPKLPGQYDEQLVSASKLYCKKLPHPQYCLNALKNIK